jgi:hypothetical protein
MTRDFDEDIRSCEADRGGCNLAGFFSVTTIDLEEENLTGFVVSACTGILPPFGLVCTACSVGNR